MKVPGQEVIENKGPALVCFPLLAPILANKVQRKDCGRPLLLATRFLTGPLALILLAGTPAFSQTTPPAGGSGGRGAQLRLDLRQ